MNKMMKAGRVDI